MQVKVFTIPVLSGERENEELNAFLRSKRVLQEEHYLVESEGGPLWCFCIKYLEVGETPAKSRAERVDYREVLDAEGFQRYSAFREIRKKIAEEDGLKVFQVFTNRELAELAKLEGLTVEAMNKVPGIGKKKLERFAERFIKYPADEKG
ncbi:MAG: HRDC domain-containing protein [bacterium]|nr:HRDC domain-containing protein [bacterium]